MYNEDVKQAYLYLKSYVYHDNVNLFLRQRLASFEITRYEEGLSNIVDLLSSADPVEDKNFAKWCQSIGYHVIPKSLSSQDSKKQSSEIGLFISNVRDSRQYQVNGVNYFIEAPIELHVLEVLWSVVVGPVLENKLTEDCYGNRLHRGIQKYSQNFEGVRHGELFRRYFDQYSKWRDLAITTATDLSKKNNDVALLSLDLKSYYYNIDLNFDDIRGDVENNDEFTITDVSLAVKLTDMLEHMYKKYHYIIRSKLKQTHSSCYNKMSLPIGFTSSAIIANWYLFEFDNKIVEHVRPAYYGRYVDDILMVFKQPKISLENSVDEFVKHYLDGLKLEFSNPNEYAINVNGNALPFQKDKLILQFFDKNHSRAGLEVFKQELEERSSAFKFLPNDHLDKELDRFAYDILYDGSENKLRSIVGLAENEIELSKYLASHITAHRLCKLDKKSLVLPDLEKFFRGQNALQFSRLWEKVYQYALVTKDYSFISSFYLYLEAEIQKITVLRSNGKQELIHVTKRLVKDMSSYNMISLSLSVGLLDIKAIDYKNIMDVINYGAAFHTNKRGLGDLVNYDGAIHRYAFAFRMSNLIRHNLVSWPLANYSSYTGDLTNENQFLASSSIIDDKKIKLTPRFLHYDEWQLFDLAKSICPDLNFVQWSKNTLESYKGESGSQEIPISIKLGARPKKSKEKASKKNKKEFICKSEFKIGGNSKSDNIKLAIANLLIPESDVISALRKDKRPNISIERQKKLYGILNSAIEEESDLLIFPEVAIPVSWLPFMLSFARRNQMAIIFGLEHWVINDVAYNFIVEAMPFKSNGKYKSCAAIIRLKNHYAPSEKDLIKNLRLISACDTRSNVYSYHSVKWRGVSFSTYNCFELSDITHRVLFKSEIDMLFACVWNKDTNYYQHILESTVRDLHCYTVQSNTSQYGGSCVLRPTKTESKTMMYVKGGDNSCLLTTKVDIKSLREFQYQSTPLKSDFFKHLPPGYNSDGVLNR